MKATHEFTKPIFEGPYYPDEYRVNYLPINRKRFTGLIWKWGEWYCRGRDIPAIAAAIEAETKEAAAPKPPAAKSKPAYANAAREFSKHCETKAKAHAVRTISDGLAEAEYEVTSGESGRTYHVSLGLNHARCSCPHGLLRAESNNEASCSHVAATLNHRRNTPGVPCGRIPRRVPRRVPRRTRT